MALHISTQKVKPRISRLPDFSKSAAAPQEKREFF
jgi:hypothetical protein